MVIQKKCTVDPVPILSYGRLYFSCRKSIIVGRVRDHKPERHPLGYVAKQDMGNFCCFSVGNFSHGECHHCSEEVFLIRVPDICFISKSCSDAKSYFKGIFCIWMAEFSVNSSHQEKERPQHSFRAANRRQTEGKIIHSLLKAALTIL